MDHRVWAGGWLPDGAFATVAARVEDISRGGARIVTPIEFAEGESVWLRLGNPSCDACVRADVLEAGVAPNGDRFARLRFREDCPESFHRVVTRGLLG